MCSAILTLAASPLSSTAIAAKGGKKPNILFIMADDLGYADLSCYGRREYETPHIDRLAEEGVKFVQAYANSPVCSATRLALITGRYQYRLRAGLEEPLPPNSELGLPPEQPTLPSILRGAGYRTSLIGKWHIGNFPKYGPLKSGYDEFWGLMGGGVDYFTHNLGGRHDLWDGTQSVDETGYLTDLLSNKAIEILRRHDDDARPFFVSLHFTAPHWPWEGPDDEEESLRLSNGKNPFAIAGFDGGSMDTYAAMVTRMDDQIGRILTLLDEKGLTDNTIVIFTSDNGGERFSDVWPFTGRKGELLEGGLRIPAIIRWPRRLPRGAISDQTMMSMDWMPSLLSAADVDQTTWPELDGIDILPCLFNPAESFDRDLYWRYLNLDQAACRSGNWKYLSILGNDFLFDLSKDPLERANLKERHPVIFEKLSSSFKIWNETMLPLSPEAFTHGFTGRDLADHFGVEAPAMHRHLPK